MNVTMAESLSAPSTAVELCPWKAGKTSTKLCSTNPSQGRLVKLGVSQESVGAACKSDDG